MKIFLLFIFALLTLNSFGQKSAVAKITELEINGEKVPIDNDSLLKTIIKIEFVKESLFKKALKKAAPNFLDLDSISINKVNGVINLPLKNDFKKFTDVLLPEIDEQREEYSFFGQIPFLNSYLIRGSYWEDSEFILIDKITGNNVQSFIAFPNISADKKYIIALRGDVYEREAELDFYQIVNGKIKIRLRADFQKWMPVFAEKMFWGEDGHFYVPIINPEIYFSEKQNIDAIKFVRITVN